MAFFGGGEDLLCSCNICNSCMTKQTWQSACDAILTAEIRRGGRRPSLLKRRADRRRNLGAQLRIARHLLGAKPYTPLTN